jgi:DNA-binding HxlR family transcriptional regulator
MMSYGQFCPVAKATEIIGEKWTLLIIRELLLGTCRFNDFQRAMSRISPTILNKRLKFLEETGIILKKRISGQKGFEYRLTAMGKELEPVVEKVAIWGQRWARGQMADEELDVELLMWDIHRRIQTENLPDGETVLSFTFTDLEKYNRWWLVVARDDIDLCTEDPGKDIDFYIASDVRTMVEVWLGDMDLKTALCGEKILVTGPKHLIRGMAEWFGLSSYAGVRPAL